jgi:hypothetical protein
VVNLRVKVWVICADPACLPLTTASRTSIMAKLAGANLLFLDQTAGIQLDLTDPTLISDQTSNPAKTKYRDFDSASQCSQALDLVNGILDKNAMNLYIVRSVDAQFGRGQTCWLPNVAALGYLLDSGLIAHEIGHNHWLQHSEFFPEMDPWGTKNIMNSLSNQRTYLSEGEVYRMHFERSSVLNRVSLHYSNPPVQRPEARSCPVLNTSNTEVGGLKPCPALGVRLWDDPQ